MKQYLILMVMGLLVGGGYLWHSKDGVVSHRFSDFHTGTRQELRFDGEQGAVVLYIKGHPNLCSCEFSDLFVRMQQRYSELGFYTVGTGLEEKVANVLESPEFQDFAGQSLWDEADRFGARFHLSEKPTLMLFDRHGQLSFATTNLKYFDDIKFLSRMLADING